MKRKSVSIVIIMIAMFLLLISCSSSVGLEEFTSYKMERDTEITSLLQEIEATRTEIASLESSMRLIREKNNLLTLEIEKVANDFSKTYGQINDLVVLAGYESSEDFLNLARDIVFVNKNIKNLKIIDYYFY